MRDFIIVKCSIVSHDGYFSVFRTRDRIEWNLQRIDCRLEHPWFETRRSNFKADHQTNFCHISLSVLLVYDYIVHASTLFRPLKFIRTNPVFIEWWIVFIRYFYCHFAEIANGRASLFNKLKVGVHVRLASCTTENWEFFAIDAVYLFLVRKWLGHRCYLRSKRDLYLVNNVWILGQRWQSSTQKSWTRVTFINCREDAVRVRRVDIASSCFEAKEIKI